MSDFFTKVLIGERLEKYVSMDAHLERREIVSDIISACRDGNSKVNIVFGLRRTGKTVAMTHAICDMTPEERGRTAFVVIGEKDSFEDLSSDLDKLERDGFEYVFVDEVTFLADFIDCSSLFHDYFAKMGMKVFLSGTDSLSFVLAERSELYNRSRKIRTTWIPFFEYARLKGTDDLHAYLEHGGVLSDFEIDGDRLGNAYLYTALAENIQHSLEYYKDGMKFGALHDLYNRGELTDAIVRFVQDKNHRFISRVLDKVFRSSDIGLAMKNLKKSKDPEVRESHRRISKILDIGDIERDIARIMGLREGRTKIGEFHEEEMSRYFGLLDFISTCPQKSHLGTAAELEKRNLLQQQGIRHLHLNVVLDILSGHESFLDLEREERELLLGRILDTARGLMTEEVVLLDTLHSLPESARMFTYDLPEGEFDMVVQDEEANVCHVFEIKHSPEQSDRQRIHLENPANVALLSRICESGCRFGRYVLYMGMPDAVPDSENGENILYLNIKDYLTALADVRQGKNYSVVMASLSEVAKTTCGASEKP